MTALAVASQLLTLPGFYSSLWTRCRLCPSGLGAAGGGLGRSASLAKNVNGVLSELKKLDRRRAWLRMPEAERRNPQLQPTFLNNLINLRGR